MKAVIALCVLACACVIQARPETHYTDRYDNVDLDEILKNRRLLLPYIKCALDQGRCTPDGKELKSHITDALQTKCAKCTATQQTGTRRVISHLVNHEADYWNQLANKYDPTRKFVKQYENELKSVTA